jgi:3-oxoacyl-[acyl-carrier protein] reductase
MFRLDGKTALVTGASQGIGRGISRLLSGQGARVVVAARSQTRLEELAEEIAGAGGQAFPLTLDLAEPVRIPEALGSLPEEWSAVDILVNNAGITDDTLLARMTLEQWQRVLDINLTGAFAVTRELVKGMMRRRWGRIVTVSSVVGLMGNPGQANYAASKAGLVGFTKAIAKELGSRGITANVVAPGYIQTAMTQSLPDASRQALEAAIALRRLGSVEDVAAAVLFLASEEAGYVTGEVLNVSGGLYM